MANGREALTDVTFQELFQKNNINADNYAIRGGTNLDTIKQIQKLNKDYDLLIVVQTDPIRQFVRGVDGPNIIIDKEIELPDVDNFVELCEHTLADFYNKLELCQKPILLIGGCAKICSEYVPTSIATLSESWTEIMIPGFLDNYLYWLDPALGLYEHARKQLKWSCSLSDFFEFEKQIHQKNYIWQSSDHFSWSHAGDSAYYEMFKKIMEVINDLS